MGGDAPSDAPFAIDDYFNIKRISELALSGSADRLAYIITTSAPGGPLREVRIAHPGQQRAATSPPVLQSARSLQWVSLSAKLAYIATADETPQVFVYDSERDESQQVTTSTNAVVQFRFAPNGKALAYISQAAGEAGRSLYQRMREDTSGILVDSDTTSSHDFLNPDWNAQIRRPPAQLWVKAGKHDATAVAVPGEVPAHADLHWSSDSAALSFTYIADELTPGWLKAQRTSLAVFRPASSELVIAARAVEPHGDQAGVYFSGGEWVPGHDQLMIRRISETDPWVSDAFPDWAVITPRPGVLAEVIEWRPIETYPRELRFFPTENGEILFENTVSATHNLFTIVDGRVRQSSRVKGLNGSNARFSFSADHSAFAFVNESLTSPPEIYFGRSETRPRELTNLNGALRERLGYSARSMQWSGRDGRPVTGWLLEPAAEKPPWPVVTHVHGGPAYPYPDAFAPYFAYWPYPFEAMAARGIAVFLPNYRGTHTFGRAHASGSNEDAEADVLSGIEHLIALGLAEPSRLGITGHSHGALVGPKVMATGKQFVAASFAEGVANSVVMYELMSGEANREIHDPIMGASLYDEPERYLQDSADLRFAGVQTASLFEAGAFTAALYMLGFPKAARRVGMPTEFIIYPQTAHNIALPELQREAARRNLDWLNFWLVGRENESPQASERNRRWRALRAQRD